MKSLGFQYELRRKGYYVDGHEKPGTVAYRWAFCERYLAYEMRMFRWVQIKEEQAKELEEQGEIVRGSGYHYIEPLTNEKMVEFHVDTSEKVLLLGNVGEFGGNLSVRFPVGSKPLIAFGHDECIYKQFLMSNKSWVGPNGESNIVPKDDGLGVMISAFQSREFGFGVDVSPDQLEEINIIRRNQKYKDERAAIEAGGLKDARKKPLTSSPFVRFFEYGADQDGYWNYQHMVLQLEDCDDVITNLYPQYDFVFLFDHSSGHDKQREDGLNIKKMTKGFGGAQRKMRDTAIKQEKGFLGTYPRKLNPGDIQSMVFKSTDEGPFWMTRDEQEKTRHDQLVAGQTKTRTLRKAELKALLEAKNIPAKGTAKELTKLCEDHGILTTVTSNKVIEGWEGKAKGLMQVLWERGFIDVNDVSKYTLNGRQDASGILMKETSLTYLMSNCQDFEDEESLLQTMGREMGVLVDRTPKCHCELAGEGIEYTWGCSKNHYRSMKLQSKKGKEKFRDAVKKCISRDLLTTQRIRKFSRRARQYICAYYKIYIEQQQQQTETHLVDEATTPVKLEKLVKLFKTHRCAMDFDSSFCKVSFMEEEEK
jgi:hypothetical protein